MTAAEIKAKVEAMREYQLMADEAAAEAEAIKDELKEELTRQGKETITAGTYKVTWKAIESSRFDSKAFKADHADLYEAYKKTSTTKRFTVQ